MNDQLLEDVVARESKNFYGWVLASCAHIRPKARKQLFYLTFVARYHGLSVTGAEILAQYGLATKRHVYTKYHDEQLAEAKEQTR